MMLNEVAKSVPREQIAVHFHDTVRCVSCFVRFSCLRLLRVHSPHSCRARFVSCVQYGQALANILVALGVSDSLSCYCDSRWSSRRLFRLWFRSCFFLGVHSSNTTARHQHPRLICFGSRWLPIRKRRVRKRRDRRRVVHVARLEHQDRR